MGSLKIRTPIRRSQEGGEMRGKGQEQGGCVAGVSPGWSGRQEGLGGTDSGFWEGLLELRSNVGQVQEP